MDLNRDYLLLQVHVRNTAQPCPIPPIILPQLPFFGFSYFALEHQSDFDVKWLRGDGTKLIFEPWRERLEARGVEILDGKRVSGLTVKDMDTKEAGAGGGGGGDRAESVVESVETTDGESYSCDSVISAVSITGIKVRAAPCCAVLRRAAPCCAVRCRAMLCQPRLALPCRVVPCRVVPCRVVPCRVVLGLGSGLGFKVLGQIRHH